jgi:hypothetical protein
MQHMGMPIPIQTFASSLQAGRDYPPNYADLPARFPEDAAYLDYLGWLRLPKGFFCPQCETPRIQVLYSKHCDRFDTFRNSISDLGARFKSEMQSLMAMNFQLF